MPYLYINSWGKTIERREFFDDLHVGDMVDSEMRPQKGQRDNLLTRPTPARQDAPFRGQGRRRVSEAETSVKVQRRI